MTTLMTILARACGLPTQIRFNTPLDWQECAFRVRMVADNPIYADDPSKSPFPKGGLAGRVQEASARLYWGHWLSNALRPMVVVRFRPELGGTLIDGWTVPNLIMPVLLLIAAGLEASRPLWIGPEGGAPDFIYFMQVAGVGLAIHIGLAVAGVGGLAKIEAFLFKQLAASDTVALGAPG